MNVCFITPIPLLNDFATRSNTHLVLAHIYEQDAEYRNFYKSRVRAGDFVILDNSAYELSEAVDVSRILACAEDLNPSAVFLPDSRFNKDRTIELAKKAYDVLGERGWKLLGVPQGNNLQEILECYRWMQKQPWIDGFGLYEEIGDVAGLGNRNDFLNYLEDNGLVHHEKYYHLLGMEEDLTLIQALGRHPWVDSIDSAKAIVYGLAGITLTAEGTDSAYPHRPKNFFERECFGHERLAISINISQVQEWARG